MSVIVSKIDKIGPKSFLNDVIGRKKLSTEKNFNQNITNVIRKKSIRGLKPRNEVKAA